MTPASHTAKIQTGQDGEGDWVVWSGGGGAGAAGIFLIGSGVITAGDAGTSALAVSRIGVEPRGCGQCGNRLNTLTMLLNERGRSRRAITSSHNAHRQRGDRRLRKAHWAATTSTTRIAPSIDNRTKPARKS